MALGPAGQAYRHFIDAGLSREEAFERATGKKAKDLFRPQERLKGDALARRLSQGRIA